MGSAAEGPSKAASSKHGSSEEEDHGAAEDTPVGSDWAASASQWRRNSE